MGFADLAQRKIHSNQLLNRMHERIMDPSVASKEPLCTKKAALDMEIDNPSLFKTQKKDDTEAKINPSKGKSIDNLDLFKYTKTDDAEAKINPFKNSSIFNYYNIYM